MRILALSHIFPPAIDGGSQIVYQAAKSLQDRGHVVHFLSSQQQSTDLFIQNPLGRILKKLGQPPGPILNPTRVIQAILFKPQIIIAGPLPTSIVFYARLLQFMTRSKVLFIPCFHPNNQDFYKKNMLNLLKYFSLWTFTDSEAAMLKPYSSDIKTHFPGILQPFFDTKIIPRKTTKKHKILFLGNFAAHKGILPLIQSLKHLPTNYYLTICGQPTLYSKSLANFHSTRHLKIIAKKYTPKTAIRLLDTHNILVLPSKEESFGLVYAEALARKIPILGYSQNSTNEVFSKFKTGVQISSYDPKTLAVSIILASRQKISLKTYALVQELCSWENVAIWLEKEFLS